MSGRWWQLGLGTVAVGLHVLVLAVLPSVDDGQPRSCPVMVHLEARATEPVAAPPPVAPVLPPVPAAPAPAPTAVRQTGSTAPILPPRHAAAPAASAPPAAAPPQQPRTAVAPAPSPTPASPLSEPGRLAGSGATGSGPVAPSGGTTAAPGGPSSNAAPPSTGGGAGAATAVPAVDTGKLLTDYSSGVASRIRQHQSYPHSAQQAGHEGKVKVSFTLSAEGQLLEASVAAGSDFAELDAAALAAVRSAAPFAPIPAALQRDSAKLSITLRFFLK